MKKSALGKGLSALISDLPEDLQSKDGSITYIQLKNIVVNTKQPRKFFQKDSLQELADSITQNGIIQPIVVSPLGNGTYQIIVGERRYRASLLAGFTTIPAIVKKTKEEETLTLALIENIQREDLNPIEIGNAYVELMNRLHLTQEALAKALGKNRSTVANTLRLLKLPPSIQNEVLEGRITEGHARSIASLEDIKNQVALTQDIITNGLTVRETEHKIKAYKGEPKPALEIKKEDVPLIKQIESDISASLDLKVSVVPNKSLNKGKVELYYSNLDELERLKKILIEQNKFWL